MRVGRAPRRAQKLRIAELDNQLAARRSAFDRPIGVAHCPKREATRVQRWRERAVLGELRRLRQNLAMVSASLAGEERQKSEYAGVTRRAKGQRRQSVHAPAQCADNVTEWRTSDAPPPGCSDENQRHGAVSRIERLAGVRASRRASVAM
jgi:hypothetical protein